MKRQTQILIEIILGVAVIILVVSFFYPSIYSGITKGTIGKADKYRQEQMTETDVQLRSEFTQDTAQLRQMITGLIYFTLFTDNLAMTIDTCLVSYNLQGFDKEPANRQAFTLMQDYSTFLKNNSGTLASTTRMLAAFLLRDTTTKSMDVEKNMRDFGVYVNQINEKDSTLTLALAKVDGFLIGNKNLQKNTEQVRNLKAIRDQLVIKTTQFMAMTGNKPGLGAILNYAIQSQSQFSGIEALKVAGEWGSKSSLGVATDRIGLITDAAMGQLNLYFSAASSLQAGVSASATNAQDKLGRALMESAREGLNVVLYDRTGLNFVVGSVDKLNLFLGQDKLNSALQGTNSNLGSLCMIKGKELGVMMNAALMANVMNSKVLNSALSAQQLNYIVPAKELSSVSSLGVAHFGSKAPLQMGLCGNASLQNLVSASPALQSLVVGSRMFNGFNSLQVVCLGVTPPPGVPLK